MTPFTFPAGPLQPSPAAHRGRVAIGVPCRVAASSLLRGAGRAGVENPVATMAAMFMTSTDFPALTSPVNVAEAHAAVIR
jgi:hypothetical protein